MEQFNFDEMKEIIKSHSLEEIDQEYDIRHSISEKENTSIINGIVDLIDPNKEIFTNNNLSSDEKLQILLMILKYQTHNIDYQKLQNMLEINHYNWQAELLKALSYIDSINLKEITFDKAQLFMKAYFSIKDLEIIDNNIYLLDTIYGKTKVYMVKQKYLMQSPYYKWKVLIQKKDIKIVICLQHPHFTTRQDFLVPITIFHAVLKVIMNIL